MKLKKFEEFLRSSDNDLNENSQQRVQNVPQNQVKSNSKEKRSSMRMSTIKTILLKSSYVKGESVYLYNLLRAMMTKRI